MWGEHGLAPPPWAQDSPGGREPPGAPLKPFAVQGAVSRPPRSDSQQSQARKRFVSSCAAFPCRTGFAGRGGARQRGGTASRAARQLLEIRTE